MTTEPLSDDGTRWSERDFHGDAPARRTLLERGATAGVLTVAAFVVFLMAVQHEMAECEDACFDGPLRTHESGHPWTGYEGAWQWQAQWLLALAGLVCGIAATASASRYGWRHWTRALVLAGMLLSAGWVVWRLLEPAVPA
jgi:hypothetical protein